MLCRLKVASEAVVHSPLEQLRQDVNPGPLGEEYDRNPAPAENK